MFKWQYFSNLFKRINFLIPKTLIPFVQSSYQNWTDLGRFRGTGQRVLWYMIGYYICKFNGVLLLINLHLKLLMRIQAYLLMSTNQYQGFKKLLDFFFYWLFFATVLKTTFSKIFIIAYAWLFMRFGASLSCTFTHRYLIQKFN